MSTRPTLGARSPADSAAPPPFARAARDRQLDGQFLRPGEPVMPQLARELVRRHMQQHRQVPLLPGVFQQPANGGISRAMPAIGIRRPAVRAEADAVSFIHELLRKQGASIRMSANFAASPNIPANGPKRLDITAASTTDLNLAYAALVNMNSSMKRSGGGNAQISSIGATPLVPGRPGQVELLIRSADGPRGRLSVFLNSAHPTDVRSAAPDADARRSPKPHVAGAPYAGVR